MLSRAAGMVSAILLVVGAAPNGMANEASLTTHEAPGPGLIDAASPCMTDRKQAFPVYCALMANPVRALPTIERFEREISSHAGSPSSLLALLTKYRLGRSPRLEHESLEKEMDRLLAEADDPLAFGLGMLLQGAPPGPPRGLNLPDREQLAGVPRFELGRFLLALAQAERQRKAAFEQFAAPVSQDQWVRDLSDHSFSLFDAEDTLARFGQIDADGLDAGMRLIVSATLRFRNQALASHAWPPLSWQIETSLGPVIIDLSVADNERTLPRPLLLIDKGGNDRYRFTGQDYRSPISVLIDLAGDDEYLTDESALCPAAAIMGYGILWDEAGNDRYRGTRLAQAAAVLGSALLYDGSGRDEFAARLQSQSFAIFGTALLINGGDEADRYTALSQAQGSAGPSGVALLLEAGGNDHYVLGNEPLIAPSAQLPDRNASLGQGTAFGLRTKNRKPGWLGGGIGMLVDQRGNDTYRAEVFAQGSGYFHGVGMLIDGAGEDRHQAAWYAQGAAAHGAVGVLISRGNGDDQYTSSHSTSIGAAHDRSLAVFFDSAGNDLYAIGGLGLAAAHEQSTALFFDLEGADEYRVMESPCRAFGVAISGASDSSGTRPAARYPGIFIDAGGEDRLPDHCKPRAGTRPRGEVDDLPFNSVGE